MTDVGRDSMFSIACRSLPYAESAGRAEPAGRTGVDLAASPDLPPLAAMRFARATLIDAAREADDAAIAAAVELYVRAMTAAAFSRYTVRSLVQAALDVGLPRGRGPLRRWARAQEIERWADHAAELADTLGTPGAAGVLPAGSDAARPSPFAGHAQQRMLS